MRFAILSPVSLGACMLAGALFGVAAPGGHGKEKGGKESAPPEIPFGEPFSLGGLGAKGFLKPDGGPDHILVVGVEEGGPAASAGILVGDKISGIKRSGVPIPFKDNKSEGLPLAQLINVLTAASMKGNTVQLMVERAGQQKDFKIKPEKMAKHLCPRKKCPRCEAIVKEALDALASGGEDRKSPAAAAVEGSIQGLAFLAHGDTPREGGHAAALRRCVQTVAKGVQEAIASSRRHQSSGRRPEGKGWPMDHWTLGFGGLFLAELYARFGDDPLKIPAMTSDAKPLEDLLREAAKSLAASQEESGGWSHGGPRGMSNNLDYREVQACGNWCTAALARMSQAGVPVPGEALEKAIRYARECNDKGGIAYSASNKGLPQIGRTGATAFAFWCADLAADPMFAQMQGYFDRNLQRMPDGHASPTMHFLSCGLAAWKFQGQTWPEFWEEYLPKMESLRKTDGTFALWPSDVGNDQKWGGLVPEAQLPSSWPTSVHALLLQLSANKTFQPPPKGKKRSPAQKK